MNPILLAGLIIGGLVLIDVLLRFAGNRGGGKLVSEAEAIREYRREYPETDASELGQVILTPDRRNAFIITTSGATGFIRGLGDRFVTRQLMPADIADLAPEGETRLGIRFNDVTLRRLSFEFASAADREVVVRVLKAQ